MLGPKGIVIGTIRSIETQANAVFQKATVDPSVDFGSLELVLVITNFDPNEALPDFEAPATITDTVQAEGVPLLAPGTITDTVQPEGETGDQEGASGEQAPPVEQPARTTP